MISISCPAICVCLLAASAAASGQIATAPPAPPAARSSLTTEEATTLTREIMPKVEQIRGRKFIRPVPVQVVNDQEARRHFESRLRKFHPEDELRTEQEVLIDLGLLPAGTDLPADLFSLLEEQAGGYYDPDTDTFYVLDDMPRAAGPVLIAHELTHALDDQHFSIDEFFDRAAGDDDRSVVAGAVVEGSGSVVMTAFLLQEMQAGRMDPAALKELMETEAGRSGKLTASPGVLQRALIAPYLLGQTLALRGDPASLARGVVADDIDRLFRDPPVSTEQLLHPAKYWGTGPPDRPRAVSPGDLSSILGEGWRLAGHGVLGELTMALLCGASNPSLTSVEATNPAAWTNGCAAGWGGDTWQIYRSGERHATLLATLWDSEVDAMEFMTGMGEAGRRPVRRGPAVVLLLGDAGDSAGRLVDEALARLTAPPAS